MAGMSSTEEREFASRVTWSGRGGSEGNIQATRPREMGTSVGLTKFMTNWLGTGRWPGSKVALEDGANLAHSQGEKSE